MTMAELVWIVLLLAPFYRFIEPLAQQPLDIPEVCVE